jgi:hypothetical protein
MVSYKYSYKTNNVFFLIHILCKLATKRLQLLLRSAEVRIDCNPSHNYHFRQYFCPGVAQKLKLALEGTDFDNEQKKLLYFICLISIQSIGKEYYKYK